MTRDEIIKIARKLDMIDFRDEDEDEHVAQFVDFLVTLVGKAEAAEREECAKIAEKQMPVSRETAPNHWASYEKMWSLREMIVKTITEEIRARSEKGTNR